MRREPAPPASTLDPIPIVELVPPASARSPDLPSRSAPPNRKEAPCSGCRSTSRCGHAASTSVCARTRLLPRDGPPRGSPAPGHRRRTPDAPPIPHRLLTAATSAQALAEPPRHRAAQRRRPRDASCRGSVCPKFGVRSSWLASVRPHPAPACPMPVGTTMYPFSSVPNISFLAAPHRQQCQARYAQKSASSVSS